MTAGKKSITNDLIKMGPEFLVISLHRITAKMLTEPLYNTFTHKLSKRKLMLEITIFISQHEYVLEMAKYERQSLKSGVFLRQTRKPYKIGPPQKAAQPLIE